MPATLKRADLPFPAEYRSYPFMDAAGAAILDMARYVLGVVIGGMSGGKTHQSLSAIFAIAEAINAIGT